MTTVIAPDCRDSAAPPAAPLFFLHVRKTAGVSIHTVLINRFHSGKILLDAHTVDPDVIRQGRHDFVTGHFEHDLISLCPVRPVLFTMLRDPLKLALSAYRYYRGNSTVHLAFLKHSLDPHTAAGREAFSRKARELGLERLLTEERALAMAHLSNVVTRQLTGRLYLPGGQDLSGDHHAEALEKLRAFDAVGLVERPDESLRQLEQVMGWRGLGPMPHENITPAFPDDLPVSDRVLEVLEEIVWSDRRLYEQAAEWLQDDSRGRGVARMAALPDGENFTFDQPIAGHGWNRREHHDRWIAWTSLAESWLELSLRSRGDHRIICQVDHAIEPAALQELSIRVNDAPLDLKKNTEGPKVLVSGEVPASVIAERFPVVKITFTIPRTRRPSELATGSGDARDLGIALSGIRLTPSV